MITAEQVKAMLANYYLKTPSVQQPKSTIAKAPIFTQDAGNCWLYSSANNLFLNTGIALNMELLRKYMESFGVNTVDGNNNLVACLFICDMLKAKNIVVREINVMKDAKQFAELLKNGISFIYSRKDNSELSKDVLEDDIVNNIILNKGSRHSTNICFDNGKLVEIGTWGINNAQTVFSYASTDVFIKSIRNGALDETVKYLSFR